MNPIEKRTAIVYHIFCTITGECYIGQTWNSIEERWLEHQSPKSYCIHLRNAIAFYGKERFVVSTLTNGLTTQEQADAAEIYWINYFDSINHGFNIKEGGSHGKLSEETKAKISAKRKGHQTSEVTRAKISAALKGRTVSQETRERLRKSASNQTEEVRAKISKTLTGRHHSEETKAKLRALATGKTLSEEAKAKIREAKKNLSQETREKLRKNATGKRHLEKSKAKMRAAKLGKKMSEETKEKIRIAMMGNKNQIGGEGNL